MGRIAGSCFMAAFFSVLGDAMDMALYRAYHKKLNQQQDFDLYKELDPELIQEDWQIRRDLRPMGTATGIINAVSWIVVCIPLFQTAWILSVKGTHLIGLHAALVVLALTAVFTEFLSTIMMVGSMAVMEWMSTDFNLSNWIDIGTGSSDDNVGWRVLEVVAMAIQGMVLWVDAMEVLFVSVILFLLFISIRRQEVGDSNDHRVLLLPLSFGGYSLVLSLVSIVEFSFEVLRFKSWTFYMQLAAIIKIFSRFILWPLWFLWLGDQLARNSDRGSILRKQPVQQQPQGSTSAAPAPVSDEHEMS
ncbi:hypothetical protein ACA910_017963 [Epithemia clementina (nom. ined.)]